MAKRDIRCEFCNLKASSLFCSLEGELQKKLENTKTTHRYERGQVLFHEGTPPYAVYCIHSGQVKLYKAGDNGERQVIRVLGPGDAIGYRAVLANEDYAATAEAIDTTDICVIARDSLFQLLNDSPSLAFEVMTRLAIELRRSEDQLVSIIQQTIRQRTANLLLLLLNTNSKTHNGQIKIITALQRNEMAQMIGTTPETFSRTLRYFAKRKILSLSRTDIYVVDVESLKKVVSKTKL